MLDHGCGVAGKIVQRQTCHRPAAAPGAARLRPQDTKTGFCQSVGDYVKILRSTATRRKHDDQGTATLGDDFDLNVVVGDDFPDGLSPCKSHVPCDQC